MAGKSARFGAAAVFVALGALGVVCAVTQPTSNQKASQQTSTGPSGADSTSTSGGGADTGGGSAGGGAATSGTVSPGSTASPGTKGSTAKPGKTGSTNGTGAAGSSTDSGAVDSGQGGFVQVPSTDQPNPGGSFSLAPDVSVGPGNGGGGSGSGGGGGGGGGGGVGNPTTSPIPPPPTTGPPPSITTIEMTSTLNADGSAASPTTTFDHNTATTIYCVVALRNTAAGDTIQYVHIHYTANTYTRSPTLQMTQPVTYFHVKYQPPAGGTFTPGKYGFQWYLNGQLAGSITYNVT